MGSKPSIVTSSSQDYAAPASANRSFSFINALPPELQNLILVKVRKLDGPGIYYCAMVQQRWKEEALNQLYERIRVRRADQVAPLINSREFGQYKTKYLTFFPAEGTYAPLKWSPEMLDLIQAVAQSLDGLALYVAKVPADLFRTVSFPVMESLAVFGPPSPNAVQHHHPPFPLTVTNLLLPNCLNLAFLESLVLELHAGYDTQSSSPYIHLTISCARIPLSPAFVRMGPLISRLTLLNFRSSSTLYPLMMEPNVKRLDLYLTTLEDISSILDAPPTTIEKLALYLSNETRFQPA